MASGYAYNITRRHWRIRRLYNGLTDVREMTFSNLRHSLIIIGARIARPRSRSRRSPKFPARQRRDG